MRQVKGVPIVVVVALIMLTITGCSDKLSRAYYVQHPMSSAEVAKAWGDPVAVVPLDGGIEKRVYRIQNPYTDLKYRYFLVKDGMVLASGISDTVTAEKEDAASEDTTGFVPSDLSRTFYSHHRTTVAQLDDIWGTPVDVKTMSDGTQYRTYEIANAYTDFKYRRFIVKDGLVVASRISPYQEFNTKDHAKDAQGIEINEISHAYYKLHPMSLQEVESVWGKPVMVQQSGSGPEKRYYKIKIPSDVGFEFRFFIVQDGMVLSSGVTDAVAKN